MEHFVTVVRKAKRPGLALLLVERASATSLPELAALTDAAKGILAVQSRKAMFHAVAKLGSDVQQHIERAAERVVLLDDEYGTPRQVERIRDQVSGPVEMALIPACGHFPHQEKTDATLAVMERFIAALPRG